MNSRTNSAVDSIVNQTVDDFLRLIDRVCLPYTRMNDRRAISFSLRSKANQFQRTLRDQLFGCLRPLVRMNRAQLQHRSFDHANNDIHREIKTAIHSIKPSCNSMDVGDSIVRTLLKHFWRQAIV